MIDYRAAATRWSASVAAAVGQLRLRSGGRPETPDASGDRPGGVAVLRRPLPWPPPLVTAPWALPAFDEDWFEVDGLRLRFETHGRGPQVTVLLHGLLLDSRINRRLAADLARRGHQVVLLDLPGHGRSDHPTHAGAHRMDRYAELVVALLDHLAVDRAVVGGVSLGAGVALHVAAQAPERTAGMVLEMPVLERAVPSAGLTFLPLLLAVWAAAPVVRTVAGVTRRLPPSGIGVLDAVVSAAGADPTETAAVLHGMLVGPVAPTVAARRTMTMPALVIGHRLDAIHPFSDAQHLAAQLPAAELLEARSIVELRAAPGRLTPAITDFLDRVWAGEQPLSRQPSLSAAGTRRQ